jgi:hypothetical protein
MPNHNRVMAVHAHVTCPAKKGIISFATQGGRFSTDRASSLHFPDSLTSTKAAGERERVGYAKVQSGKKYSCHRRTQAHMLWKKPHPSHSWGILESTKIQAKKRRAQKTATSYEQTNERRTLFVCLKSSLSHQPFRSPILPGHRALHSPHTHVAIIKKQLLFQISITSAANFPIFCLHASNTCGNGTHKIDTRSCGSLIAHPPAPRS